MPMASAFLPFQSTNRGLPPPKKFNTSARRGSPPAEWRKVPAIGSDLGTTNAGAIGPAKTTYYGHCIVARGAGLAVDNTAANSEVAAQDRQSTKTATVTMAAVLSLAEGKRGSPNEPS